jgi:hypothetical protein
MTIQELIGLLDSNPLIAVIYFAAIPLIALLLPLFHGKAGATAPPYRYIYSALVHLSCIPGLLILFILIYLIIFQNANILALSVFGFFLPIASMLVTLLSVRNSLAFSEIPGISRLGGFFGLLLCSFLIIIFLDRMRIYLFFRGSFVVFLLIWIGLFLVLKYSIRLIWKKSRKE